MARYLVTGGAGFIGGHLVERLVREGHEVRVLDNLSTGKRENLAAVADSIELLVSDLNDRERLRQAVQGVDYVLHQAALPSVPRSVADPLSSDQNNVRGTLELLVACRDAGVKRVVQASSSSVYGDTPTLPKVETMPRAPQSPYAVSKAAAEMYGLAFRRNYGLEYVALRYFNVFGPRQDPKSQYAAVIPLFVSAYLKGTPPTVYGDGTQSRDFCFVENVVDANLLACEASDAAGRVFNIACGQRISLLEVLSLLSQHFGRELSPRHQDARVGDVKHSLADISAASQVLDYKPKFSFQQGLKQTIAWYQQRVGVSVC